MKKLTKAEQVKIKNQALIASKKYDVAMLLDNNFCKNAFDLRNIEFAIAVGAKDELCVDNNSFIHLDNFIKKHHTKHVFTWLTYDLKNQLENLSSSNTDSIDFRSCYAFLPEKLLMINDAGECIVGNDWAEELLNGIVNEQHHAAQSININQKVSHKQYIEDVEKIRQHIIEGDVYELNYCIEFFAEHAIIDPEFTYSKLIEKSPAPFAAFIKHNNRYLLCASPERFIARKGERIYSQPIKGTSPRGRSEEEDNFFKQQLTNSEKEQAENLMIVDLVRNDLAKTAETGTVRVEELFGIYKFPQVHQMISTISSKPHVNFSNVDNIKEAFPMGSMTGAPKIMAMELIEQYEQTKRGLYSGSVGYFAPDGNFDFNVVIRSIQYNKSNHYLNFEVGSAITYDSVAEDEYNECLLKAKAIMEVLKET